MASEIIYAYNKLVDYKEIKESLKMGLNFQGVMKFESKPYDFFINEIVKECLVESSCEANSMQPVFSLARELVFDEKSFFVMAFRNKDYFSGIDTLKLADENYVTRVKEFLFDSYGESNEQKFHFAQAQHGYVIGISCPKLEDITLSSVKTIGRIESDGPFHTFVSYI